jgi:TolA-binding protein
LPHGVKFGSSENDLQEEEMKTIKMAGIMIGAWLVLVLGLGMPFSRAAETKETGTAPSGQQEKQEYQKKIESKLKELNQELREWKGKAKKMEKNARAEMDKQLNKLNKQEGEVSRKLKELKSKSGKAWEDLKAGMDSAMEELGKAFDDMRSRFKSS